MRKMGFNRFRNGFNGDIILGFNYWYPYRTLRNCHLCCKDKYNQKEVQDNYLLRTTFNYMIYIKGTRPVSSNYRKRVVFLPLVLVERLRVEAHRGMWSRELGLLGIKSSQADPRDEGRG